MGNPACEPALRVLEQAVERTSECYARTAELLFDPAFFSASPAEQSRILAERRAAPYWSRYQMEWLEPLLQTRASRSSPVFPHLLFLLSAHVDVSPLLRADLTDGAQIRTLLLQNPRQLCPDRRLPILIQTFVRLLDALPPSQITCRRLMEASGLPFPPPGGNQRDFLRRLRNESRLSPGLRQLLDHNLALLGTDDIRFLDLPVISTAFQLSLTDSAIPYLLRPRFSEEQLVLPAFRPARNVAALMLGAPDLLFFRSGERAVPPQRAWSAALRFWDTHSAIRFPAALVQDIRQLRPVLEQYRGALYFYLDDYGPVLTAQVLGRTPAFFRVDLPWDQMGEELARQGFPVQYVLLQRYSETVFFSFCFGGGNAAFSMHFHWELQKAFRAFYGGGLTPLPDSGPCYGPFRWEQLRDLMAAVTEDQAYAGLSYSEFRALRLL